MMRRALKWGYFVLLLAMTGVGAWAAWSLGWPYAQERRAVQASSVKVDVYPHPFVSIVKDAVISGLGSSADRMFTPEVFRDAIAESARSRALPLTPATDRDAWTRDFAADLAASLNDYMGRRYRDSVERLGVSNDAKSLVEIRIADTGDKPVDDMRVEVRGGQLFMEGPQPTAKLRSLGTRTLRFGTLAAGASTTLFVLSTQDTKGDESPRVQITAQDKTFPAVVHLEDAPAQPTLQAMGWIAFATAYAMLIAGGVGALILSLAGFLSARPSSATITAPVVVVPRAVATLPPRAPLTAAQREAWQRPDPVR